MRFFVPIAEYFRHYRNPRQKTGCRRAVNRGVPAGTLTCPAKFFEHGVQMTKFYFNIVTAAGTILDERRYSRWQGYLQPGRRDLRFLGRGPPHSSVHGYLYARILNPSLHPSWAVASFDKARPRAKPSTLFYDNRHIKVLAPLGGGESTARTRFPSATALNHAWPGTLRL